MKIPGSDGNDSKIKLNQDTNASGTTAGRKAGQPAPSASDRAKAIHALGDATKQTDSINVSSLGSLLRSELDPTKFAAERKQRVEELKKQIKDGTYKPPLQDVAKSVSEELSVEILLAGSDTQESDSGLL